MPDPLPIGRKGRDPVQAPSKNVGRNLVKSLKPFKKFGDAVTKGPVSVAQAAQKLPGKALDEVKDKAKKARALVKKIGG